MRTFRCPKCGHVLRAVARAVGHYCPANRTKWTEYKEQEDTGGT